MKPNYILGLSAFYHDSAACLLRDGEIVAAAQEERFTRKKGDSSFPASAVDYCLRVAEIHQPDLDFVAFYDKPLLKFERILDTYMAVAPRGLRSFLKAGPLWIKNKLYTDSNLRSDLNYEGPILYSQHHESHAASAFLPSPFKEAAILTMDGVGEWATASIGIGREERERRGAYHRARYQGSHPVDERGAVGGVAAERGDRSVSLSRHLGRELGPDAVACQPHPEPQRDAGGARDRDPRGAADHRADRTRHVGALSEEISRSEFSTGDRELGRSELTPLGKCSGAVELEIVP